MKVGELLKVTTAIIFSRRALSMNLVIEEIYVASILAAGTPAILTEVYLSFTQSLQAIISKDNT
jgi:hypothetical protein